MLEVGLQLGGSLLRDQGVSPLTVFGVLQEVREKYYKSVDRKTGSGSCDG
jgi:hypothetical protein